MNRSLPRTLACQPELILSDDISEANEHSPETIFPITFGDPLVHVNQGIRDTLVGYANIFSL